MTDLQGAQDQLNLTITITGVNDEPTLVVVGEEDAITPVADAAALHEAIPGSRLSVLPGSGHLSNLETPDAFGAALARFLAERVAERDA